MEREAETDMRGVLRALSVLRALNVANGSTIMELHHATGISRTALYRIARTLQNAGYLALDAETQSYRLTAQVKHLSEGYHEEAWVTEIVGPVLDRLQQTVIWPTDLFSFFDDTMIMRRTTRRTSPWTIDQAIVGFRTPVLVTACGRAYLAHLPEPVLQGVLARLRRSLLPEHAMAHEPAVLRQLLEKVRRDGYALREAWFMRETGSIAVPVMVDGVPRCTVAITYISSAISAAAVVDRFAPLLQQAASEIAAALTAREGALA